MLLLSSGSVANDIGMSNLSVADATLYAVLGYAVVFFGLFLLMLVIMAMGKIFIARDAKLAARKAAAEADMAAVPVAPHTKGEIVLPTQTQPAPGTAGQLKLYDVEPKTAAMIMAIVANKMGKPLNELRFISIKEVK